MAQLVPIRSKPVYENLGKCKSRVSVEYTDHGYTLCYDGFGGRWFRASIEWVKEGCDKFVNRYIEDGQYVNYNDLYDIWGIEQTDFGYAWGYSPSYDWRCDLAFNIVLVTDPTHKLVQKMGEPVLVIEPTVLPIESYLEV